MALFTVETYRELKPHDEQEWLLTNGLGGFASSTIVGMNTRRYHGLLCAATLPPVGRVMTINRIGEILTLDGKSDQLLEFSCNAFRGSVHPRGDQYLDRFELDDTARWHYDVEGVHVTKQLQMLWLKNVVAVRYTVDAGGTRPFELRLLPFASLRDFHATRHAGSASFRVEAGDRRVTVGEGPHEVTITSDDGSFTQQGDWWYGHVYPIETERGQDDVEDLFSPGRFVLSGQGKGTITLWIGLEPTPPGDWEAERKRRCDAVAAACTEPENIGAGREHGMVTPAMGGRLHPVAASKSAVVQKLFRASNDFVVYRKSPSGEDGTSVIAGYPWFSDWGRDTMISLPGLLLVPGRYRQAREVLTVFAQYVSEGMIPNRFDDYTNEPSYNTVDASLWFVHAVHEYARLSHDSRTF
ncbi:MAG TPA: glycogen debranching enzyme N-terminal domain-containing protein, partial [Tepidisphaeraceae bacterium]|nr:glycogen debranching enzyme N-terminal domain-containing protein [Tepidisphaeraceae bacterium]